MLLAGDVEQFAAKSNVSISTQRSKDKVTLMLRGIEEDVVAVQVKIYEACNTIEEGVVNVSADVIKILTNDVAMKILRKELQDKTAGADVSLTPDGELFAAVRNLEVTHAAKLIEDCFFTKKCSVAPYVTRSGEWESVRKSLEQDGLVLIKSETDQVTVFGFRSSVEEAMKAVQEFKLKEVQEKLGPIPKKTYLLLRERINQKIQSLEIKCEVTDTDEDVCLLLRGRSEVVNTASENIQGEIDSTVTKPLQLPDLVLTLLNKEKALQEMIKILMRQNWLVSAYIKQNTCYLLCHKTDETKVCSYINNMFLTLQVDVPDPLPDIIEAQKKVLIKNDQVIITGTAGKLVITGFKEEVKEAKELLELSLKGTAVVSKPVTISSPAEYKYLEKYMKRQIDNLSDR